jgi:methionyl-tRNA formyltransferase
MKTMKPTDIRFAFFGTSHIARYALEAAGLRPACVVTMPDAPRGRGLALSPSAVAEWASAREIPILKPERLDEAFIAEFGASSWDVCVVVDYGRILPQALLDIPRRGFLNVHPSLLPRLRGPSPIRSAILRDEKDTGVTLMLVDAKMDHGPIIAQKRVDIPEWPPHNAELERILMTEGGALLCAMLPVWVAGDIEAHEQNHDIATYCEKFTKADGELDLSADGYHNLLKIRAFEEWPGTYARFERGGKRIRVQILDAHLDPADGRLKIDTVKPEGKNEMRYEDFLRSGAVPSISANTNEA